MEPDLVPQPEPGSQPEKIEKHEKFARLVAEDPECDASGAYRKAYPGSKAWTGAAVWGRAFRLKRKVMTRVAWLQKQAEDATIAQVLEIKQGCTRIFRALTKAKATDFIKKGRGIVLPADNDERGLALGGYHYSNSDSEKGQSRSEGFTMRPLSEALKAVDILNEMEHRYQKAAGVNVLNQGVLFVVEKPPGAKGTLKLGTGIVVQEARKAGKPKGARQ